MEEKLKEIIGKKKINPSCKDSKYEMAFKFTSSAIAQWPPHRALIVIWAVKRRFLADTSSLISRAASTRG